MKLKKYIKNLQEIAKEYGDDLDVIWAIDDGGMYCTVLDSGIMVGHFLHRGDYDNEFYDEESCREENYKINSVLIN